MTDGLKDAHREAIIAVIAANDRVEGAVLFGSRATGTNTVTSDVDIALFGDRLTLTDQARLTAALEEIPMAQTVDLILYDSLRDRTLRKHIRCEGVEWYARPTRVASDPENWPMLRFKELLEGPVRNGIYKRKEYKGHGMKIVNMGELFAHPRLRAVPMKRVSLSKSERERFSVVEGDLLFARRSLVAEGAGKCCVVLRVDEPTTFESSIIRARPDPTRSDSLYLYYFFGSPLGLHLLDTIRRQVAVAGITGKDLSELTIPAPAAPEQRAIAHVLGTLDDKIELNRRMSETLEAMARALFKSWFVDFDPVRAKMEGRDTGLPKDIADLFPDRFVDSEMGPVPKGWRFFRLEELTQHHRKSTSPFRSPELEYEHFSIPAYDAGQHPAIDPGAAIRSNKTVVPDNAVLLSKLNPRIARVWVPPDSRGRPQVCSTEFLAFTPRPPANRSLLFSLFTDQHFRALLKSLVTGTSTSHQRVPPAALKAHEVLAGSRRLFAMFGEATCGMLARILNNRSEAVTLAALRDTLLPKLISGEIRLEDVTSITGEMV